MATTIIVRCDPFDIGSKRTKIPVQTDRIYTHRVVIISFVLCNELNYQLLVSLFFIEIAEFAHKIDM